MSVKWKPCAVEFDQYQSLLPSGMSRNVVWNLFTDFRIPTLKRKQIPEHGVPYQKLVSFLCCQY
jgi:hypothetical protein